jgi:D-sedoheptulose 7-phosphate isomerase
MGNIDIYKERIKKHLEESVEVKLQAVNLELSNIVEAANLLAHTFNSGKKLLLCGNGGSAAACQHLATEFVSQLSGDFERQGLPAIALTTDSSFLTAHSNDYSFKDIFKRQIEALGQQGDVLLGITTGGKSENIIRAFSSAKQENMKTIALIGPKIMQQEEYDIVISVPSNNAKYIQEAHLVITHIICDIVECILFSKR